MCWPNKNTARNNNHCVCVCVCVCSCACRKEITRIWTWSLWITVSTKSHFYTINCNNFYFLSCWFNISKEINFVLLLLFFCGKSIVGFYSYPNSVMAPNKSYRAFQLVVKLVVNNTCYWLKQITWFILANSRCCLLHVYLQVEGLSKFFYDRVNFFLNVYGTHKEICSKSCYFNRKMVNIIWFRFDSIRFLKVFSMCKFLAIPPGRTVRFWWALYLKNYRGYNNEA